MKSDVPSPAAKPVSRIADVDALRGFALLGILQVNILAFSSVFYGFPNSDAELSFGFNELVQLIISTIFEMKFYLLFSFLFGYSVTLQMQSAERAGEAFVPRFLRRQAGLWIVGLLHAVLLFHGDILTTYAVLGVVLLYWRNKPDNMLIKAAVWLFGLTALLWLLVGALFWNPDQTDIAELLAEAQLAHTAYSGSFSAVIMQHITELQTMWILLLLIQAPCALAMFLLGFLAGRHQFLAQTELYRPYLKPAIKAAIVIGLPASVLTALTGLFANGTEWEVFGLALTLVTAPLLTFGIIALMLRLFGTKHGQFWRDALAPAGAYGAVQLSAAISDMQFHFLRFRSWIDRENNSDYQCSDWPVCFHCPAICEPVVAAPLLLRAAGVAAKSFDNRALAGFPKAECQIGNIKKRRQIYLPAFLLNMRIGFSLPVEPVHHSQAHPARKAGCLIAASDAQ